MDQYLNNRRAELLWKLLANPANKDGEHAYNLQQLIADYPQSGLLQALLSYTEEDKSLKKAAVYSNPKLVYKLANDPGSLAAVTDSQIISRVNGFSVNGHGNADEPDEALVIDTYTPAHEYDQPIDILTDTGNQDAVLQEQEYPADNDELHLTETEHEITGGIEELPAFNETFAPPVNDEAEAASPYEAVTTYPVTDDTEEISAKAETAPYTETPVESETAATVVEIDEPLEELSTAYAYEHIIEPILPVENEDPEEVQPIDDDIYDEIVSIEDISKGQEYSPAGTDVQNEETAALERKDTVSDAEEKLILNNIVSTDFFVFDRAFGDHKNAGETENEPQQAATGEQQKAIEETSGHSEAHQDVSKYNDEKMPYSFMWWLDKTRKQHAGVYQPYVNFKLGNAQSVKTDAPDELQQQYYENIFHLTSVEELERGIEQQPVVFDTKKKEDEIIERFIQEVPQIKPQSGDKIDNENKAKKSSEDRDEMVTETLAAIYADQMLYPKAIATYKKLMLKFPEKSRYFASQIEQLEKKTN